MGEVSGRPDKYINSAHSFTEGCDVPKENIKQSIGSKSETRYKLVSDNSGHDYVIPVQYSDDWYKFMDLDEDDPASWDVPEWAEIVGGGLTFTDPRVD